VFGATQAVAQEEEFKIGVVASLTGGFAAAAKDAILGVDAWIKKGGIPGKKVNFVTLDDETNPVNASNAFRRLAADPEISLIYLFLPSNSALAIKAVASEFKVPILSGGGADSLGVPADPYFFKVAPGVRDYMIVVSEYVKKKGYKRVATLTATDAFGQFEFNFLNELAPQYGYELVAEEKFGVEDTNVNAQVARIKASNPELVYNGATSRAGILTYKQIKQLGIEVPLVMNAPVTAFYDAIGGRAAADGLLMPTQLGVFGTRIGGDTARLYAELVDALGHEPVYFNIFGYDVGLITRAAVENSDGSREGIRTALESLDGLPAINGPVTFVPDNHTGQGFKSLALGVLKDGALVPAE
jgi:branched-chain amino acid transport system substrate-binding protein